MDLIRLQAGPFDLSALTRELGSDARVGAVATFLGQAKGQTEEGRVLRLEFSADEPMALGQMQRLASRARERFGLSQAALVHRLGELEVGEPIVFVGAAAPHRKEALAACQWLIDNLKLEVPIWKAEMTPRGRRWVTPSVPEQTPSGTPDEAAYTPLQER